MENNGRVKRFRFRKRKENSRSDVERNVLKCVSKLSLNLTKLLLLYAAETLILFSLLNLSSLPNKCFFFKLKQN